MYNLKKAIIPYPKNIEYNGEKIKVSAFNEKMPYFDFGSDTKIEQGVLAICEKFKAFGATEGKGFYKISISANPHNIRFKNIACDEAYYIEVQENEAILCGRDTAGALYAAFTFCQMLFVEGEEIFAAKASITDYPDFKYRGHYMESRYGSEFMTKENYFSLIDDMASMKLNQLTLGMYGCWSVQYDDRKVQFLYVPIKKYPQLKTEKNIKYYSVDKREWVHRDNLLPTIFEEDLLGEIMAYGKKKNVIVKPLFNSLGHNTLIPEAFPETCAVNENGERTGFGFCTKNEKTHEVMFEIYDEIIDRYLLPNEIYDFHVGLDEVGKNYICHCEKCRNVEHSELLLEYTIRICKHLKGRGIKRIYIYHDMLYHEFNIVNEELRERFIKEGIYDEVVLDWWSYEDPKHLFWDKKEGVNNLFHSVIKPFTGYHNWAIAGDNNENIRACVQLAKELEFEGVEAYGTFEHCYDKNYLTLADVSWNSSKASDEHEFNERYAYRYYPDNYSEAAKVFKGLSDIMKDETGELYMNRICFKFDYYFYSYHKADLPYPQNFPGDAYKLIKEDESTYIPYFEFIKQNAAPAVEFFKNKGRQSRMNSVWLLTAQHYYTAADEYLTLYGLYKSYNENLTDEFTVLEELERLIGERERLMLFAENTRIPATSYMYLRNMSIFREFMLNLKDYFKKEIAKGARPKLEMCDLHYATGKELEFLQ